MTSKGGNAKNGGTNRKGVSFSTMSQFWTQGIKKNRFKIHSIHCPFPFLPTPLKMTNSPTLFVHLRDLIAPLLK